MLNNYTHIYFLGIGGIGMSALARYFKKLGKNVSGYDRTDTAITEELVKENIDVHYKDDVSMISSAIKNNTDKTLVIITPAIPPGHRELQWFNNHGFLVKKRSEILGLLTTGKFTIAVAGTHGKTSVSAMIAHLLISSGAHCTVFLGGISVNYNSNFISMNRHSGTPEIMIAEADEYDRSFHRLTPDIAVITSMDADHLDIYGTRANMVEAYLEFAGKVKEGGTVLVKESIAEPFFAVSKSKNRKVFTYSVNKGGNFRADNISVSNGQYRFSLQSSGSSITGIPMPVPGRHNIENATAATAVCLLTGTDERSIMTAWDSYRGVKRRFEYHVNSKGKILIDDYAHHPSEVTAFISAVRELYPGKKITGVYQPHLFSRTRDFAGEFARSLDLLDEAVLLEIYPAREQPIHGVTSQIILDRMTIAGKSLCHKKDLPALIRNKAPEVLLTIGAGDIDSLIPELKKIMS